MNRVICGSAINVEIDEHEPTRYMDLIQAADRLKGAFRVRGDRFGMLSYLVREKNGVRGFVETFTRVDADSDWIEVDSKKRLDAETKKKLNLLGAQPNSREFRFALDPDRHIFVVEVRTPKGALSAGSCAAMLERMFQRKSIRDAFGEVRVTVVPNIDTVDRIISSTQLKRLDLVITPPNGDDESPEAQFLRRFDSQNLRRVDTTLYAKQGRNIELDAQSILATRVAALHGGVVAKIHDGRRQQRVATDENPLVEQVDYDEKREPPESAFARLVEKIGKAVDQMKSKLGKGKKRVPKPG